MRNNLDCDVENSTRRLDGAELDIAGDRIPQRGDPHQFGSQLFQKFNPFGAELRKIEKDPGDVAAGPMETLHQPGAHWIGFERARDDWHV